MTLQERITGCLLGTAVGDAIGLPREGLSRRRSRRIFGDAPLKHALLPRRGMCSDDTEHAVMIAQALISSGLETEAFKRDFAARLRWWLIRIPAGVGLATLRACCKLWIGFGPEASGVPSAGVGPAMRSALLGLAATNREHLTHLVNASTRLTHTDPRAEQGAAIIALAAQLAAQSPKHEEDAAHILSELTALAIDADLRLKMERVAEALANKQDAYAFADSLGWRYGVSGFVNDAVPAALFCWLRHRGNFRSAVEAAVLLGGDADTVGAIVGALAGADVGPDGIPREWLDGIAEWPASVHWLRRLAEALATCVIEKQPQKPPSCSPLSLLLRNLTFASIVLAHGLRRLLPPY